MDGGQRFLFAAISEVTTNSFDAMVVGKRPLAIHSSFFAYLNKKQKLLVSESARKFMESYAWLPLKVVDVLTAIESHEKLAGAFVRIDISRDEKTGRPRRLFITIETSDCSEVDADAVADAIMDHSDLSGPNTPIMVSIVPA
jgi:hypothetical protein